MPTKKVITEEDHVEFKNESDLSYSDNGGKNISLFVKDKCVGECNWIAKLMEGSISRSITI